MVPLRWCKSKECVCIVSQPSCGEWGFRVGFSFGKPLWAGLDWQEAAVVVTEGFWHVQNGCLFLTLLEAVYLLGGKECLSCFSFFFFFSKFPLYFFPFCFKLAFARILCDFSPSSEVLKLLLKLPLKKAFSELTMEKSILLSLSYILMCWAQSVGQRGQKPAEFFLCQISMELLLGNMGVAMVSQSLSPPSPGTDEDSCWLKRSRKKRGCWTLKVEVEKWVKFRLPSAVSSSTPLWNLLYSLLGGGQTRRAILGTGW